MTRRNKPILIFILFSIVSLTLSSIVIADEGIYRERASISVPDSGMTMEQVESKFGQAQATQPSVGSPPITRWEYNGFTVYFEHQRVIHSVITS